MPALAAPCLDTLLREAVHPLTGSGADFEPLLDRIGDARFVLLGEASHGTHEFYAARAALTQRLIAEQGFTAVAVEADWPDAYRINRYVRGAGSYGSAQAALDGFRRFPAWMWRNTVVRDFVTWLRAYNDALPPGAAQTGFYGLDLYSLFGSMTAVVEYLDRVDRGAAQRARERYACFDHYSDDAATYGYAVGMRQGASCEDAVVRQLTDLLQHAAQYRSDDGRLADDNFFYAEQNARVVQGAEEYYRSMFRGRASSWNLRDRHMADTLDRLAAHLEATGDGAKIVVWAHNSHLGNAAATEMADRGEWNVGQLVREQFGDDAVLIGFSTHNGTVTAASDWDKPPLRRRVRPGLEGSYEALFHDCHAGDFLLLMDDPDLVQELEVPRLERAIGVIYRPDAERYSHYFYARLPDQFDAVLHFDTTRALGPLDRNREWERSHEAAETFPTGM